jgi:antitoxin StbD
MMNMNMDKHIVVPVTDAKARLTELLRDAEERDVLIVRHGKLAAVLIGAHRFEALVDEANVLAEKLEDARDRLSVYESEAGEPDLRVPIEKVKAELGLL